MKVLLDKFFNDNEHKTGLCLLDSPTGSGKTYSVLDYIAKRSKLNKGRVCFVTELKKNLPEEELKKAFARNNNADNFETEYLYLKGFIEYAKENFTEDLYKSIDSSISDLPWIRSFWLEVKEINNFEADSNNKKSQYMAKINDDFVAKERAFRSTLKFHITSLAKELRDTYSGKNATSAKSKKIPLIDFIDEILAQPKWAWLYKLYPSLRIENAKIIMMTTAKFFSPFWSLRRGTIDLSNDETFLKNTEVYFDEFHNVKGRILTMLTEEASDCYLDLIHVFSQLRNSITYGDLSKDLLELDQSGLIQQLKESLLITSANFKATFSFKSDSASLTEKNFLFYDHRYHSVLNAGSSFSLIHDPIEAINVLSFKAREGHGKGGYDFISDMQRNLNFFTSICLMLAENLDQIGKSTNGSDLDRSIISILNYFHLQDVESLLNYVRLRSKRAKSSKSNMVRSSDEFSVYNNGFKTIEFVNSDSHSINTKVYIMVLNDSPENKFVRLCEKAKVLGISATATTDTVIGNFDIGYLKDKLGDLYFIPNQDDLSSFYKEITDSFPYYEKINMDVRVILGSKNIDEMLILLLPNSSSDELAGYSSMLGRVFPKGAKSDYFRIARFLKVLMVFKLVAENESLYSFVAFLNYQIKGDERKAFDGFTKLINFYSNNSVVSIEHVDSSDFDNNIKGIKTRLGNGERIFIVTYYKAIGSGQNLQYPTPSNIQTVDIMPSSKRSNSEKDLDGVYIENPTHILPNHQVGAPLNIQKKFDVSYYLLSLVLRNEISNDSGIRSIRNILKDKSYSTKVTGDDGLDEKVLSVRNAGWINVIQAIGRMCRTRIKNTSLLICVDEDVKSLLPFDIDGKIYNLEFVKLYEKLVETFGYADNAQHTTSFHNDSSVQYDFYIGNVLWYIKNKASEEHISIWQNCRNYILMNPTLSDADYISSLHKEYYIHLPEQQSTCSYWFSHFCPDERFSDIEISFSCKTSKHTSEVSAEDVMMDLIARIPLIKQMFIDNGYKTYFSDKYILNPFMYNNFYKGALGEVIGKCLVNKYANTDLAELRPEIYEDFDYVFPESDIFIDFKYWKDPSKSGWENFNSGSIREHIFDKLSKAMGTVAFIVNIFGTDEWNVIVTERDGMKIIEIPYLYNTNTLQLNVRAFTLMTETLGEKK